MVLQCGTTNNACSGKTGLIRVEYTIPDPPYVRYKYPSSDWANVVEGVRFENNLSRNRPPRYYDHINAGYTYVGYGNFTISGIGVYSNSDPKCQAGRNHNTVNSPDVFLMKLPSYAGHCGSGQTLYYGITCRNSDVDLQHSPGICGWSSHTLTSNFKPCPCDESCVFKVFDIENKIIFSEARDVCPTVEVMPSVYGNNQGQFNVKSLNNQPLKVINTEANNIKSTFIQLGNTTVKKLDSPSGSILFPKVCWDCEEDKCPEGTCEVVCANHICCYDRLGNLVKTILK